MIKNKKKLRFSTKINLLMQDVNILRSRLI